MASPLILVALAVVAAFVWAPNSIVVELGLVYLGVKLLMSARSTKPLDDALRVSAIEERHYVAVLVPMYNEDPEILTAALESLLHQSRPPDSIHVIDDGSSSSAGADVVRGFVSRHPGRVRLSVHATNRGKREAMATGVHTEPYATLFVTVDSDTVVSPGAVEALVGAFADYRVKGATGMVRALNGRANLLTRLIDVRYANAFLLDRGFQSRLGSVLCACGSLAAWRREVLVDDLDDFVTQRFLGERCTYGDDRRLTNYALRAGGRVVLVPEAVAHTATPERISHYLRQQARWSRSFLRESLWAVLHLPLGKPAMWLSLVDLVTWFVFSATVIYALVVIPTHGARLGAVALGVYLLMICAMAWLRSVRWFDAAVDGERHPRTFHSRNNLAVRLGSTAHEGAELPEATRALLAAEERRLLDEMLMGGQGIDMLPDGYYLAVIADAVQRQRSASPGGAGLADALARSTDALRVLRARNGDDETSLKIGGAVAALQLSAGDAAGAESTYRSLIAARTRSLRTGDFKVLDLRADMAKAMAAQGRWNEAIEELRQAQADAIRDGRDLNSEARWNVANRLLAFLRRRAADDAASGAAALVPAQEAAVGELRAAREASGKRTSFPPGTHDVP